jgi:uncharacterized cofD-like protein
MISSGSAAGAGRIVAIGGGAGPALVASALPDCLEGFTAIVCTSDRGSSSGVCRRLFDIPAPGDLRASLSAMAMLSGKSGLGKLWETRLHCPASQDLHGMALGNLIIAALAQERGDFAEAIETAGQMLGIVGRVLPVSVDLADLEAHLEDGTTVRGETEVRSPGKPPIRRLRWSGPVPRPAPGVLEAIGGADLILIGPGCLYTSLLPCLMVQGVAAAVRDSEAIRIYLCNSTTTPGQTDGFSAARHVQEVLVALGGQGLDAAILHDDEIAEEAMSAHEAAGVRLITARSEDLRSIASMGVRPFTFPLLEDPPWTPRDLHKVDTVRHDPAKLRSALEQAVARLRNEALSP